VKTLIRAVLLLALIGVAGIGYAAYELNQPYKGFGEPVFIEFPHGTSTSAMATTLADKRVIRSRWLFLAARALRRAHLQAGEYRFEKPVSALDVYGRIARGDIFYVELLVPEGYNMFDIAGAIDKLENKERLPALNSAAFLAAARNPAAIQDLDPAAKTLEGYLFPNKYRLYRHSTAQQLCHQMTNEFRTRWKALNAKADVHDTVTLASLVEREARLPEERARVASVFANRLRTGMKLDCDPTTVYAALMENRYTGVIHRSDLDSLNPYNTYQHGGLPPGPIANPGISSIKAALTPAESPYFYFVARADGTGGHNFSTSLSEHEAAVAQYHSALHK
jgi:UPF0755 protein